MKQFIAFIKKEFYHILRDKRTMLILIGMPVVQIILFGFAISTEVRNVQTAVLINSANTDIQRIVDQLDASEYFNVKYVVHSPTEIEDLFAKNKIELAVAFADDLNRQRFDSEQIQIIADATDPNLAVTRGAYANGVLSKALAAMGQSLSDGKIIVSSKLLYNPQMKSAYNFVPGVMGLILMLICAMMTSISIVREKETGTMEILLVSPMNPLAVILSKAVPYFVLSVVNLTTILLLSVYVLDVPIAGSLVGCISLVYFCFPCSWTAHIVHHSHAGSCPASLGNGTDDTYYHFIRNHLPNRKYASYTTMDFLCHSCPLVCITGKTTDDRRSTAILCMERSMCTPVYGCDTNRYYL